MKGRLLKLIDVVGAALRARLLSLIAIWRRSSSFVNLSSCSMQSPRSLIHFVTEHESGKERKDFLTEQQRSEREREVAVCTRSFPEGSYKYSKD